MEQHHEHTDDVLKRLARAIGHLQSVKKMVEENKDCSDVLTQLAAVKSALNSTGKLILKDHIEHCITNAVQTGDREAIANLERAIEKLIK